MAKQKLNHYFLKTFEVTFHHIWQKVQTNYVHSIDIKVHTCNKGVHRSAVTPSLITRSKVNKRAANSTMWLLPFFSDEAIQQSLIEGTTTLTSSLCTVPKSRLTVWEGTGRVQQIMSNKLVSCHLQGRREIRFTKEKDFQAQLIVQSPGRDFFSLLQIKFPNLGPKYFQGQEQRTWISIVLQVAQVIFSQVQRHRVHHSGSILVEMPLITYHHKFRVP